MTITLAEKALKDLAAHKIDINHHLDSPPRSSFGLPALDLITGGLPLGRVTILWGQQQSGKTTTSLYATREMIRAGRTVLWIDAENSFDANYAAQLGVDLDGLVVHKRRHMESAEEILAKVRKIAILGIFGLIVIDSSGALPTIRTLEGDMEDKDMGNKAKLFTRFFEAVTAPLEEHNTALIVIAQMRKSLGGYTAGMDTMSGGEALKHASSLTIKFKAVGGVKAKDKDTKEERLVATIIKPVIVKTRVSGATLQGTAEIEMRRERSGVYIDTIPQLRDAGAMLGLLVDKDGKAAGGSAKWFFQHPDGSEPIELAVGKAKVADMLRDDPELCALLTDAIYGEIQKRIQLGGSMDLGDIEMDYNEDDIGEGDL